MPLNWFPRGGLGGPREGSAWHCKVDKSLEPVLKRLWDDDGLAGGVRPLGAAMITSPREGNGPL